MCDAEVFGPLPFKAGESPGLKWTTHYRHHIKVIVALQGTEAATYMAFFLVFTHMQRFIYAQ